MSRVWFLLISFGILLRDLIRLCFLEGDGLLMNEESDILDGILDLVHLTITAGWTSSSASPMTVTIVSMTGSNRRIFDE